MKDTEEKVFEGFLEDLNRKDHDILFNEIAEYIRNRESVEDIDREETESELVQAITERDESAVRRCLEILSENSRYPDVEENIKRISDFENVFGRHR